MAPVLGTGRWLSRTAYRTRFESAGLRFTGFDAAHLPAEATAATRAPDHSSRSAKVGQIRACELPGHSFFIGTLFQPERSALEGRRHPLIEALVRQLAAVRAGA